MLLGTHTLCLVNASNKEEMQNSPMFWELTQETRHPQIEPIFHLFTQWPSSENVKLGPMLSTSAHSLHYSFSFSYPSPNPYTSQPLFHFKPIISFPPNTLIHVIQPNLNLTKLKQSYSFSNTFIYPLNEYPLS